MRRLKFALVGDQHVSETPPPNRTDDYTKAIFDKIRFILEYCRTKGITHVFFLGDMFHWKVPTRNSHWLVHSLISLFLEFKDLNLYSLVGNHDFTTHLSGIVRQPLWTIAQAKAINLLGISNTGEVDKTPLRIDCDGFIVEVVGVPYIEDQPDSNPKSFEVSFSSDADFRIALYHATLLPDGQKFFDRFTNFADILPYVDANLVGCGHYHPGYNPPVQVAHNRMWANPGAISRGTAEDHNMTRQLGFLTFLVDDTDRIYKFVPIPCRPASEVFDVPAMERKKEEVQEHAKFITSLTQIGTETLDISSITYLSQLAQGMTTDLAVSSRVTKLLQRAEQELET